MARGTGQGDCSAPPRARGGTPAEATRALSAIETVFGEAPVCMIELGSGSLYDPETNTAICDPAQANADVKLLHELGHAVFTDEGIAACRYDTILDSIYDSRAFQALKDEGASYRTADDEVLAQAYAHYVAFRSGDPELTRQLAAVAADEDGPICWKGKDFIPVAAALAALLKPEAHWCAWFVELPGRASRIPVCVDAPNEEAAIMRAGMRRADRLAP